MKAAAALPPDAAARQRMLSRLHDAKEAKDKVYGKLSKPPKLLPKSKRTHTTPRST